MSILKLTVHVVIYKVPFSFHCKYQSKRIYIYTQNLKSKLRTSNINFIYERYERTVSYEMNQSYNGRWIIMLHVLKQISPRERQFPIQRLSISGVHLISHTLWWLYDSRCHNRQANSSQNNSIAVLTCTSHDQILTSTTYIISVIYFMMYISSYSVLRGTILFN